MNKILLLIVLLLVPVTIVVNSKKEDVNPVFAETLEKLEVEVPDMEMPDGKDEVSQVLISNNKDKSNPYYLDLEEYVIGVVAGEMPASFSMEALKAQAVASRTFAMYKMKNVPNYILSTTINDQVYLGIDDMKKKWGNAFSHYYDRIKNAVNATKGEVVTYQDEIIIAYYFAISNGYTDSSKSVFNEDRNYLVSVPSLWDKNYKAYSSKRTISKKEFCNRLGLSSQDVNISNVVRADNNYVREITINNNKFTGKQIFNKLLLKSTDFDIQVNNDNVIITTRGFGHGVGLSQYGAEGMARDGYLYQDILKYYYKNTEIKNISGINL